MAKILLVEDDRALVETVVQCLSGQKHTVEKVYTGKDARDYLLFYQYDLVILDIQLPGESGIELCKEFRNRGNMTPVLMLTGKSSIDDKEAGLDAGADDYLTKPFHVKELLARVRALLRRPGTMTKNTLQIREIELDPAAGTVVSKGKPIKLVPRELALLEFFMRHPNQIFSVQNLLDRVWESSSDATSEAVTTCIKRLRQKLDARDQPSVITTVHGLGYKMEDS